MNTKRLNEHEAVQGRGSGLMEHKRFKEDRRVKWIRNGKRDTKLLKGHEAG